MRADGFSDSSGGMASWGQVQILAVTCYLSDLGQVWTPCESLSFLICKMAFIYHLPGPL